MCGIVGFTGSINVTPVLLDGLKRLEYRGYDSAGVVVYSDGKLKVSKTKGEVNELVKATNNGTSITGSVGMGHTRWATHGEPSDVNAHPHLSMDGKIAVVHNGIIENYQKLREMLISEGYEFKSQTDTEVAVNLISYFYKGDMLQAIAEASRRLEGSYALGIINRDEPEKLYCIAMGNPLILGKGEGFNLFASDVTAIIKHTKDVYYFEVGDICVMTKDSYQFFDKELKPVDKKFSLVEWDISAAEKGGYEHFMFKEIMEQPEVVKKTIARSVLNGKVNFDELGLSDEYLNKLNKLYIVACGSSYHVGVVAKYNIEKLARIPVEVMVASEFRYCEPLVDENTLVICISQSGTTADTLAALREAKALGAKVLSIVNVMGSAIAKESDAVIYTMAGVEIAVATTKAYSTQLIVTYMIAMYLAEKRRTITEERYAELISELHRIPSQIEEILSDIEPIQRLASIYFNNEDIFFIGRNIDYALSLEASLKLKEISYIHSDAYAAGELKHGTISLIEKGDDTRKGTLVIAIASYMKLLDKTMSNVQEVRARGAQVLSLTTKQGEEAVRKHSDSVIIIPDSEEMFAPSLAVVPMQLFAYYVALLRGCSIDKPRNLAKSVTVE